MPVLPVPSASALLRFQPTSVYRFVCGAIGLTALFGDSARGHRMTALQTLGAAVHWCTGPGHPWGWPAAAHQWVHARAGILALVAMAAMVLGVLTARGMDGLWRERRSASTALAGCALAVETGREGTCALVLLVACVIALAVSYAVTRDEPYSAVAPMYLAGEVSSALLLAALCAFLPVIWLFSKPDNSTPDTDAKLGI